MISDLHAFRFTLHRVSLADPAVEVWGVGTVVRLVGWVQRAELGQRPKVLAMLPGHAFGAVLDQLENSVDWRWFTGAEYGWVLRDMVRFEPVAARGKQKLWALSSTVYTAVRRRYDVARKAA